VTDQRRDGLGCVRTEDPHEAATLIEHAYLPNRVDVLGAGSLGLRLNALRLDSATVGLVSFGTDARIRTVEATHYHVNIAERGTVVSRMGAGRESSAVPGRATVFMPDHPADIVWGTDSRQLCLMIPRATLVEEMELLLGRSLSRPLVFEPDMDLTAPAARGWRNLLSVLRTELTDGPGLVAQPHVARQLERLVIDGLLLGQPHNYTEALSHRDRLLPSASLTQAKELLEQRPEDPWSTSSLALHVHLSVRSLQEGFRREFDMPPMKYLQHVRLRRARDLLREASSADTTVGIVASSLGLFNMGRFAAAYRRKFGESPSETLRRT
jgi:AraC-like DNA-binding protein